MCKANRVHPKTKQKVQSQSQMRCPDCDTDHRKHSPHKMSKTEKKKCFWYECARASGKINGCTCSLFSLGSMCANYGFFSLCFAVGRRRWLGIFIRIFVFFFSSVCSAALVAVITKRTCKYIIQLFFCFPFSRVFFFFALLLLLLFVVDSFAFQFTVPARLCVRTENISKQFRTWFINFSLSFCKFRFRGIVFSKTVSWLFSFFLPFLHSISRSIDQKVCSAGPSSACKLIFRSRSHFVRTVHFSPYIQFDMIQFFSSGGSNTIRSL